MKFLESFDKEIAENFFLLAGPCVVENEDIVRKTAEHIKIITEKLGIPFVFKSSYKKANRSRLDSFTGIGDEKALKILEKVKKELDIPIVTDIHTEKEAEFAAQVADIIQIPAFLARQTDLLTAAGKTGRIVNIKKGQFMSPDAMKFAAEKVKAGGNHKIMLTERGSMFGYGDLIVDFRSIPKMKAHGFPVVTDITHSLQQPNQSSGLTGGNPELIQTMGRAAVAAGTDGIFLETHPNPAKAKSDGANMLPLHQLNNLLAGLVKIRQAVQSL